MVRKDIAESPRAAGVTARDYICSICKTKVVDGDHTEAECNHVKWLKEVLASSGHKIQAC